MLLKSQKGLGMSHALAVMGVSGLLLLATMKILGISVKEIRGGRLESEFQQKRTVVKSMFADQSICELQLKGKSLNDPITLGQEQNFDFEVRLADPSGMPGELVAKVGEPLGLGLRTTYLKLWIDNSIHSNRYLGRIVLKANKEDSSIGFSGKKELSTEFPLVVEAEYVSLKPVIKTCYISTGQAQSCPVPLVMTALDENGVAECRRHVPKFRAIEAITSVTKTHVIAYTFFDGEKKPRWRVHAKDSTFDGHISGHNTYFDGTHKAEVPVLITSLKRGSKDYVFISGFTVDSSDVPHWVTFRYRKAAENWLVDNGGMPIDDYTHPDIAAGGGILPEVMEITNGACGGLSLVISATGIEPGGKHHLLTRAKYKPYNNAHSFSLVDDYKDDTLLYQDMQITHLFPYIKTPGPMVCPGTLEWSLKAYGHQSGSDHLDWFERQGSQSIP